MKRMTSPSASATSLSTALRRSSNSPRYFAPATARRCRARRRACRCSESGTSPSTIRWARPSTIAVLPTPGSPISTGLFFVRRARTWMTRRISSSRPITGSSLPSRASAVRSRPYFSSAWYLSSGFWSVTRCGPRTCSTTSCELGAGRPASRRASPAASGSRPGRAAGARRRCSRRSSRPASRSASRGRRAAPARSRARGAPCVIVGRASSAAPSLVPARDVDAGTLTTLVTTPSGWSSSAQRRCSGVASVRCGRRARRSAASSASRDRWVDRVESLHAGSSL